MSDELYFATISNVYEDGVTLLFDGEATPSEKHYKVNTSVFFSPGDRVKILPDSGTYVVEYVVGAPQMKSNVLPSGGAADSVLKKQSDNDFDVVWEEGNMTGIPSGGTAGQVLKKQSDEDGSVVWSDDIGIPSGGSAGQVLAKDSAMDYDTYWATLPNNGLPSGGTAGQFLVKSSGSQYDARWATVTDKGLPSGGSDGQVLVKSGSSSYVAKWSSTLSAGNVINQANTAYRIYFRYYSSKFQISTNGSQWHTLTTE